MPPYHGKCQDLVRFSNSPTDDLVRIQSSSYPRPVAPAMQKDGLVYKVLTRHLIKQLISCNVSRPIFLGSTNPASKSNAEI